MKTTYTIAAIAMFAVILGMSALAPAMAVKQDKADKIYVCHFSEEELDEITEEVIEEAHYVVIHISENGWNGHQNHYDDNGDQDYRDIENNDKVVVSEKCTERNDALDNTAPTE